MNSSSKQYNIMLVDDHALFREGLKLLLNTNKDFNVIAEASNGKELLNIIDKVDVDVVLLDIAMPEMNGIEAAKIALKKYPNLKIITLSMFGDEAYYYKMMETGASGFLLKESDIDEVYKALYNVIEGKSYFSQELLQKIIKHIQDYPCKEKDLHDLSEREMEIITLVCKGFSNTEIGEKLFVSKRTVEKHRANIMAKTNSKNTASLVVFAIKNNIFEV